MKIRYQQVKIKLLVSTKAILIFDNFLPTFYYHITSAKFIIKEIYFGMKVKTAILSFASIVIIVAVIFLLNQVTVLDNESEQVKYVTDGISST